MTLTERPGLTPSHELTASPEPRESSELTSSRVPQPRPAPTSSRWAQVGLTALIVACSLASAYRGLAPYSRKWGTPHLYLNYSEGLVRRGLVGEVYRILHLPAAPIMWAAGTWVAMFVLVVGLAVLGARARHLHPATVLALITSQFLPTMAFNSGYLDAYIFVLVTLVYWCVSRGWWIAAGVAALTGPLVHEQFVFFMLPLGIVAVLRWRHKLALRPHLAALGAALATSVVMIFLASRTAAATLMEQSPLPRAVVKAMVRDQLGQTVGSSLRFMMGFWSQTWQFALPILLFMIVPALLMFAFNYRLVRRSPWVLSGLAAPLCMLFFAWDLSRIAVMGVFLTFVLLALCNAEWLHTSPSQVIESSPASAQSVLVAALFCVGYFAVPALYAYPSYGYVLETWDRLVTWFVDNPRFWPPR